MRCHSHLNSLLVTLLACIQEKNNMLEMFVCYTYNTEVDCGPPQESANTVIKFATTTYGSTAVYKCNLGYELSTGAQSLTRECLANGIWEGSIPVCNRK